MYICAECVELCQSIIDQEKRRRQGSARSHAWWPSAEALQEKLRSYLRLPAAEMKTLAEAVHSHYASPRGTEDKNLLLLVGSSRSGAGFMARALAHVLAAPFASGQAKDLILTFSSTQQRESTFFKLLSAADFDVTAAQHGIVYLAGIESREAQETLLQVLREGVRSAIPPQLRMEISPILFICQGDFLGLDEEMTQRGRHPEQPIVCEDLLACGVSAEFVRRVRAIVRARPLDDETLAILAATADLKCFAEENRIG